MADFDASTATHEEFITHLRMLFATGEAEKAVAMGFQRYEALVEASKNSSDSTSTKKVREHVETLEEFDAAYEAASSALQVIKQQVFNLLKSDNLVAVALYDLLGEYKSDELKAYRDHVLKFYSPDVDSDSESDEDEQVAVTSEELETLKKNTLSFWNIAGEPDGDKDSGFTTKVLKSGKTLAFSRIPKNLDSGEAEQNSTNVTTKRQVWFVNGERSQYRNASGVAMFEVSDGLRTYTATEMQRAIAKSLGKEKFSEVGEFTDVVVNGVTISRKVESAE